jgi:hypothetical protein
MSRVPVPHYVIPGLDLELVDIIKAKSRVATNAWEFFLWASCLQYLWRYDLKGEPGKDLDKAIVYLTWLKESADERNR